MFRGLLLAIAIAAALTGTATGVLATAAAERTGTSVRDAQGPTQVTVTRPRGFAWREALLGASAAGALVALAGAGAGLRAKRRTTSHPPAPKEPR